MGFGTWFLPKEKVNPLHVGVVDDALVCLIDSGFSCKDAAIAFHKLLSFTLGAAMMKVNLNQTTNESDSAVHDVMTGSQFDTSLREIIVGLR